MMSVWYGVMCLVNHSHYQTFGDLAIFNQAIWQYSQFKWPYSTFHLNRPFLGDHFHPLLMVLAPLYWIWPGEETLLVAQAVLLMSAMIPLYLIGYKLTKSAFFSLCVIFAYAFYLPLQYTMFFDFHEIALFPPLFAWTYWAFLEKKRAWVWIGMVIMLLVKEEVGFFVASFGLYLLLFHKGWRKMGLFWAGFGAVYSVVVVQWVIPKIGGSNIYLGYGEVGQTPAEVLVSFLKNPIGILGMFVDAPEKIETLHRTFWPYGYLSLLSPLGVMLSLEQFFTRFVDQVNTSRWTIGYHYSAMIAVVVPIGAMWTAGFYSKFVPRWRTVVLIGLGILLVVLTRVEQINRSAVLMIKRPQFWSRDVWMDRVDKAVSLLPDGVSVATQRNIVAHVSTRLGVYPLNDMESQGEYILVDFHPGQAEYNFYALGNWQEVEEKIQAEIASGKLEVVYNEAQVYLLKKRG